MSKSKSLILKILTVVFLVVFFLIEPTVSENIRARKSVKHSKESVFRLKFTNGVYTGTGFMINTVGNMLTCAHVVDSSSGRYGKCVDSLIAENYVTLQLDSNIIFNDVISYRVSVDTIIPELDLAILTVDLTVPIYKKLSGLNLAIGRPVYMGFANSDSLWEGQEVFTCAYIKDDFTIPKPVIAKGVISTIRENCYDPNMKNKVDIIQLDLNISKGNSGAPIFLPSNGRVIGLLDWGIFGDSKWQTGYAVALTTNQIVDKLRELKIPVDFR